MCFDPTPSGLIISGMRDLFARIFSRPRLPAVPVHDAERYARERDIMRGTDSAKRLALARNPQTHQEILFFLAQNDPEAAVRMAAARNWSTPLQASPAIANDRSEDVRLALARRLVALLPELSAEQNAQLYAFAEQALSTLAQDNAKKIRLALSDALKDHSYAPPPVLRQLARDVEQDVAEPILRTCLSLSDDDLLGILAAHPAGWAVQAIARRKNVSDRVSAAVIAADDRAGGRLLLSNKQAAIGETLLQDIVRMARQYTEWQTPVALRDYLPVSIATMLAEFADSSVRSLLLSRKDFKKEEIEQIAAAVRKRLEYSTDALVGETPQARVKRLHAKDALSEEIIADALTARDRDFVLESIAVKSGAARALVDKTFDMSSAKQIVALCWRAGLSMRLALRLQQEAGRVHTRELLYPRDGVDYPLSKEDLQWQLEFMGFKKS